METVLGIDLGTTHSAMAAVDETGKPRIIMNREGKSTTPSAVWFKDRDSVVVGQTAKNNRIADSVNVVELAKRHMCEVDWESEEDEWGNTHGPEEISAYILKKLKQDAEEFLGTAIRKAVITVPAYFQDMERQRTRHAGEIAGLEVLRMVNEPVSAALAYGLHNRGDEGLVMVYDLGGGTFDVTIMKMGGDKFEVLATDGNRFLGGFDFDDSLIETFADNFERKFGIDPLENSPKCRQDFWLKAENAKIDLSSVDETNVFLQAEGDYLELQLKRNEFDKLIKGYIDSTLQNCRGALEEAGKKLGRKLEWEDIAHILLVGGSTRIPLVRKTVEDETRKKAETGINPDEVVAIGAAIFGALESGSTVLDDDLEPLKGIEVIDVTAHSLGVIATNKKTRKDYNSIIIPKNTPIPANEKKIYTTIDDNQTNVHVVPLQGEANDPEQCTRLGDEDGYLLSGIPSMPAGKPVIEYDLSYDREGIVHLTATEESTGKQLEIHISNPSLLTSVKKGKLTEIVRDTEVK